MTEESQAIQPMRLSQLVDMPMQAMEHLLNDLDSHGLRVYPVAGRQWRWEWNGHMALANGLGSAITTATYWYFGLLSDSEAAVQGIS